MTRFSSRPVSAVSVNEFMVSSVIRVNPPSKSRTRKNFLVVGRKLNGRGEGDAWRGRRESVFQQHRSVKLIRCTAPGWFEEQGARRVTTSHRRWTRASIGSTSGKTNAVG